MIYLKLKCKLVISIYIKNIHLPSEEDCIIIQGAEKEFKMFDVLPIKTGHYTGNKGMMEAINIITSEKIQNNIEDLQCIKDNFYSFLDFPQDPDFLAGCLVTIKKELIKYQMKIEFPCQAILPINFDWIVRYTLIETLNLILEHKFVIADHGKKLYKPYSYKCVTDEAYNIFSMLEEKKSNKKLIDVTDYEKLYFNVQQELKIELQKKPGFFSILFGKQSNITTINLYKKILEKMQLLLLPVQDQIYDKLIECNYFPVPVARIITSYYARF